MQRMIGLDVNDVFLECVDKWTQGSVDSRISKAMERFDDWIRNFDEDEKDTLSELLKMFNYYSYDSVMEIIKNLSNESISTFGVSNDNSIVSIVRKSDGKLNSSNEYCLLHRMVSGLSKKIYYDSLDGIEEHHWNNIKNIVFVDDCSGTGTQFVKFLQRQKKSFKDKRVILIVIEIVEDAKKVIMKYAKDKGMTIEILSCVEKEKAFKSISVVHKERFNNMSNKQEISDDYILGFKKAEALMAFYNNSPNDTLGLFWYPFGKNIPIFEREMDDEPGWKNMCRQRKERRRNQYAAKCN